MKPFNYCFFFLFVLFAAVQYNDPDPYIWVPIYLYSAALCFLAARRHFYPKAYAVGVIVYVLYALWLFFDKTGVLDWATEHKAENIAQSMKATKPWIEETREFFGLLILIAVLGYNWRYYLKRVKGSARPSL
ncbi:transmembrane 220 family protein [Foetidibacter luteolus]|uniref:transmembrane 220 family protein n=1 Tax=Foetidibacter luteolus TaxID=2608880 RepID=UPI00129B4BAA|nr:transmembrane 220 family protein [Foetidibacter luteolus]